MAKRVSGIYGIHNTITDKWYVGSSVDIRIRWMEGHRLKLRKNTHPCTKLQNSWNKYGEEPWELVVLELCEPIKEELRITENKWIEIKDSYVSGYNMTLISNSHLGIKRSPETREKIRKSKLGEKNPAYGKKASEETRNRMREAQSKVSRKPLSTETIEKLKASWKHRRGTPHTEEAKEKIRRARLGKPGKKHSEETKKKISETLRSKSKSIKIRGE